ncbi:MAG: LamG domain-containing protein [Candidatus Cloacimonetes bacterium]|nr:LamG domain-containing protein [Candidatus Cloacimonadota bacterium]
MGISFVSAFKDNYMSRDTVSGIITTDSTDYNITFDGDDYVTYAHSDDFPSSQFSLTAWIYPEEYSSTKIVNKGAYSIGFNNWYANCDINGKKVQSTFKLNNYRWHQIVCTFDGTTLNLYINGEKACKSGQAIFSDNGDDLVVGKGFDGYIDRVEVSNSVLSYSSVNSDFKSYLERAGGKPAKFDLAKFFRTEKKAELYDPDVGRTSQSAETKSNFVVNLFYNFFSKMRYMFSSPSMFFQGLLNIVVLAVVLILIGRFIGRASDAGWSPGKVSSQKASYGWFKDKDTGILDGIRKR